MKIIIERQGGINKVTKKFNSVDELIKSANGGFVNIGEDEHINLAHVVTINVVEDRPEN